MDSEFVLFTVFNTQIKILFSLVTLVLFAIKVRRAFICRVASVRCRHQVEGSPPSSNRVTTTSQVASAGRSPVNASATAEPAFPQSCSGAMISTVSIPSQEIAI